MSCFCSRPDHDCSKCHGTNNPHASSSIVYDSIVAENKVELFDESGFPIN